MYFDFSQKLYEAISRTLFSASNIGGILVVVLQACSAGRKIIHS